AWQKAVEADSALGELALPRILTLSRERLAAKDYKLAQAGFFAATSLSTDNAQRGLAYRGLAEAALAVGDVSSASSALLEVAKVATPKEQVELQLQRAELLENSGDLDGAGESLEAALAIAPRFGRAISALKRVLAAARNWTGPAEILAVESSRAPKDQAAPLFEELGRIYLDKLSETGPAEAAFRRAAALDRTNVYVRRQLVTLAAQKGDLASATKLMEEAAEHLPAQDGALMLRDGVRLALEEGNRELALRLSRRAHKLSAAAGEDLRVFGELLYERGALKEALPIFEKLSQSIDWRDLPDLAERTLLSYADLAEQHGDFSGARNTLEQVLRERPWSRIAAQRLSQLLARSNPRAAIEVLWNQAKERHPSAELVSELLALSERARTELQDLDFAATIAARAAELSSSPLEVHRYLAGMYRESGRTGELMSELLLIADGCVASGDLEGAIAAYEEEATLAETVGRVDEAIQSLVAIRELCEDDGEVVRAAVYERRRAELLRDAKLDLEGAEAALQKSFELHKSLETALLGVALSRRREDYESEADWVERSIDLRKSPEDRARALLELARLFETRLNARAQAEAAARESLKIHPGFRAAEELLGSLLEKDGRIADLAAMYEESAERATDARSKADLYRKAASLYADRAGRPDAAAAALLAARAAAPDDLDLTAEIADRLHQLGRAFDAAEFDALLLESDPFREHVFARHAATLEKTRDYEALASLHVRRGQAQQGEQSAESFLMAAEAFRKASGEERARICEDQAFERAPQNDVAFKLLRERRKGDVRKLSDVLLARARAVPAEAPTLLSERAAALKSAGEALLAAAAYDDLLAAAPDELDALVARAELAAEAGGARAAQPYDRRVLAVGGDELPMPIRTRAQLRLGHASLSAGAFGDAAQAFETVFALDPSGERGREALSLLAEVHAQTRNAPGLFRTTLRLAKDARPDEAEALYRRAAELFDDPKEAVEALLPLARMRPADAAVVDRAVRGLKSLGRYEEVLELSEKSAEALGGAPAAERLLLAAQVAEDVLHDAARAQHLKIRAGSLDPTNPIAVRALIADARERDDEEALISSLERYESLLLRNPDRSHDELSGVQLDLAKLLAARGNEGDATSARMRLEALIQAGPASAGYGTALEQLGDLLDVDEEPLAVGKVFAARAELASGEERAMLLLSAAQAFSDGGETAQALTLCRAALAAHGSARGHRLAGELWEKNGQLPRAAQAWANAAKLSEGEEQGEALLKAADLYEAAGEPAEARELVEKLAAAFPKLMPAVELAKRFARLGATDLALTHGFGPAMAAGDYVRALELAEAANDPHRAREALWAAARTPNGLGFAERLSRELTAQGAYDDLFQLAKELESVHAELSHSLYETVCFGPEGEPEQLSALTRLLELGHGRDVIARSVQRVSKATPIPLLELLVEKAREVGGETLLNALAKAAPLLPWRKAALSRELFELRRAASDWTGALSALSSVLESEQDFRARAALLIEQGEIERRELSDDTAARESFELALTYDLDSVAAVKQLVELYAKSRTWDRLVAMADRLQRMAGDQPLRSVEASLVDAYEALGRRADAHRVLSRLPETEENLRRRASLAAAIGLYGEALALRERLTDDATELEEILQGYVKANLLPFAVRLADKLLERGSLRMETRALLAERLSPTKEGAALAIKLWQELMPRRLGDADAWTLFSEALRVSGNTASANLMDGFGAALAFSDATAHAAELSPLQNLGSLDGAPAIPEGAIELSIKTMPRLHATLSEVLAGLKIRSRDLYLDPSGGVTAYVADGGALVIGVGALAAFGPAELGYLVALAWALGADGQRMLASSDTAAWADEAAEAFAAAPTSLGAARVVGMLDPQVAGDDPQIVDLTPVLKKSAAFRAIALKALSLPL
ncbi:MAG: flagellar hook-length control protein FliK, partial [Myxococcaceae bacterium]